MSNQSGKLKVLISIVISLLIVVYFAPQAFAGGGGNDVIFRSTNQKLYEALKSAVPGLDPDNNKAITDFELSSLTCTLDLNGKGITDIAGLQYCTGIEKLDLSNNTLANMTPFTGSAILTSLTELDIEGCSLSVIPINLKMPALKMLQMRDNPGITSLDNLQTLTTLEYLFASGCGITEGSLTNLYKLTNLKTFQAADCDIKSFTPFSQMSGLVTLDLSGNHNLSDTATSLSGLTSLQTLVLADCSITSLEKIKDIASLKLLSLNNLSGANSLGVINQNLGLMANLESLNLGGVVFSAGANWDNLGLLPKLGSLIISRTGLRNISFLNGTTTLRTLVWSSCGVTGADLDQLSAPAFSQLANLDLMDNGLTNSDLAKIAVLHQLTSLFIHNNTITSLSEISGLTHLKLLNINNNSISDLAALSGMNDLCYLTADGNYLDPTPGSADRTILDTVASRPNSHVTYDNQRKINVHYEATYGTTAKDSDMGMYYGQTLILPTVTPITGMKMPGWDMNNDAVPDAPAGASLALTWTSLPVTDITYKAVCVPLDAASELSGIALSPATLSLSPAFTTSCLDYTVTLPVSEGGVTLTPAKPASATMTIDGEAVGSKAYELNYGQAVAATIAVTAETGSQTVYHVSLSRAMPDAARLTALGNSAGTLSPAFSPYNTSYTLTLPEGAKSVTLKPVKAVQSSKLYINNKQVSSKTFKLDPGKSTKATLKVVSASGAKCTYTITIKRSASTNANLKSLSAGAALSPQFDAGISEYAVKVPEGKASVTVKAAKADKNATVYINGKKAASKNIKVKNGQTVTVTVTVKAQAGNTKTYKLVLSRPPHINSFKATPLVSGTPTVVIGGKPVKFNYSLAAVGGSVRLEILYNGAWSTLLERNDGAGAKTFTWNGTLSGTACAPGKYPVRLAATGAGYSISKIITVAVK